MNCIKKISLLVFCCLALVSYDSLLAAPGAVVPWTTYEAEDMNTSGYVSGPQYYPGFLGTECSGRRFVQLYDTNQFVEFTANQSADALVIRYGVPDTVDGLGADYTLNLYTNGVFAQTLTLTSKYSWLYGNYPFNNNPNSGSSRNLFDEVRLKIPLVPGELVRLQKDAPNTAAYYNIDLMDLEIVPGPLNQPVNSLSVLSYGADATGIGDATTALKNCISAASSQGKSVWVPAGIYKITSAINLPSNITIQGAGMWHSTFFGDPALYSNSSRRVALVYQRNFLYSQPTFNLFLS
ncbi:MAG: glycosyl hydrolase family 28-related protein [Verrucomicrobiota bacterium]